MAECECVDSKGLAQAQGQAAGGSKEEGSLGGGSVWVWRKYGEKLVSAKKQALKRSYFRCVCPQTHATCPARKRIDRIVAGPAGESPLSVSLINRHNHTPERQAGGDWRCSSCTEEGAAAPPACWCRGPGATLQPWGMETWSNQELAREMCSDLVSMMPSPGVPRDTHRSASLRRPPSPALPLPCDVSCTPENGSTRCDGLEPGLCWLGGSEEHGDMVCPADADSDAGTLGETLSLPLRFCSDRPPSPQAVSQKWQLPSMQTYREERRVKSEDFDWPTRGSLDQGPEEATGGSSCLDFDWGAQGQGFECGTPGTMESPWELCSSRREGPSMGMLLLGEEGGREAGAARGCAWGLKESCPLGCATTVCKKRKKTSEDVPTILAKLRKMLDARSGKTSPPSPEDGSEQQ